MIVHNIIYDRLPDVWYLKLSRADVLGRLPLIPCYLNGNSVNTIPRSFRSKISKEATADFRPDSGPQGAQRPTPTQSTCLYYYHDHEASKCVEPTAGLGACGLQSTC
jgi:hypothetical protein